MKGLGWSMCAPSDLTQKTMVLHGDFFGGSYVANPPVACGRVEAVI